MTQQLNRQRRIDWPRIIANLRTAGMSLQEIADVIDVDESTIRRGYLNEDAPSEPAYYVGHSLVALWCMRCGCKLADVPIKTVPLSVAAALRAMR